MARLLEVYKDMLKEAEFSKMAEEVQLMFEKYAETAESLLKEEYGTDFNAEDIESLARGLMERDSNIIEETEKVAEYEEIGRQLARDFAEEVKTAAVAGEFLSKAKNLGRDMVAGVAKTLRKYPKTSVGAGLAGGAAVGAALAGGDK